MDITKSLPITTQTDQISEFLSQVIHAVSADKMLLEANVLNEKMQEVYAKYASGDVEKIADTNHELYQKFYVTKMVNDYFSKLSKIKKPNQLGMTFSNSMNMLVWVEIDEDDEVLEDALILLQAETNSKYGDKGFNVKTTIVENEDKLPIPPHYTKLF